MKLNEKPLLNTDLVKKGTLYIVDGVLTQSTFEGTVLELKSSLQATEIKSCDMIGRKKLADSKPVNKQERTVVIASFKKLFEDEITFKITVISLIKWMKEMGEDVEKEVQEYSKFCTRIFRPSGTEKPLSMKDKRNFLVLHTSLVELFNESKEK